MPIDENRLPPPDRRGYEIAQSGAVLRLTMRREIETMRESDRWATTLSQASSGTFERVEIHLSTMIILTSTVIAGLVHITDRFARLGCPRLTIVGANDRIVRSLEMMQLHTLFDFEEARVA